jgi:hypothetical protein
MHAECLAAERQRHQQNERKCSFEPFTQRSGLVGELPRAAKQDAIVTHCFHKASTQITKEMITEVIPLVWLLAGVTGLADNEIGCA